MPSEQSFPYVEGGRIRELDIEQLARHALAMQKECSMSLNRMTVAALVSLGLLAMASETKAMDPDFSDPVASCGFPSTVGVNGALCQGAFLGQGLVLTAAHCVDELSENPADLYFGDRYLNDSQSEFTYEGASCILHPSWNSSSQEGGRPCSMQFRRHSPGHPACHHDSAGRL